MSRRSRDERRPIQEEPESTIGRRPDRFERGEEHGQAVPRSGAAIRREEGDETEAGGEPGPRA